MKLKTIFLYIYVTTLLFLCSCNNTGKNIIFDYSNMIDSETQTFVVELLERNEVKKDNIDNFFILVNDFYDGYESIINDGWTTVNLKNFAYDENKMQKYWNSLNRPNRDINCRVAAFILTKDNILLKNTYDGFLFDGLVDGFDIKLTNEEIQKYSALYSEIFNPLEISSFDRNDILNIILSQRQKYGIEFDDNSTVKSLFLYIASSTFSNVQNYHTAVVVQENDYYYLIEKYNPKFPYQISKFISENDLIEYILDRCKPENIGDIEIEDIIIMMNNKCIY